MALLQESVKKDVYPRVILKRLCESLTHPYQCSECPQRFHKLYDATAHYLITHQDSNEVKEDKVVSPKRNYVSPERNYVSQRGIMFPGKGRQVRIIPNVKFVSKLLKIIGN